MPITGIRHKYSEYWNTRLDLLQTEVVVQEAVRSSCGSSCWSYCLTLRTRDASRGTALPASSSWQTRMKWPDDGENGRASQTWTTTSWAEPWDTTTTKISWPRYDVFVFHLPLSLLLAIDKLLSSVEWMVKQAFRSLVKTSSYTWDFYEFCNAE